MHEFALRVPGAAVDDAFDVLLPLAPHGVIRLERGGEVELRLRGAPAELPAREVVAAAAEACAGSLAEREVPDDWHERRLLDYEPFVIADRFVIRPLWAPPADPGLVDIVLEDHGAFGNGRHATTQACLEELAARDPAGSLADLGSGSGVLAIAAALLGSGPVVAVDSDPQAVHLVRANAAHNGVAVDVVEADVTATAAPIADTIVANVPLELHPHIARGLTPDTKTVIASGVLKRDVDEAAAAYAAAGLREDRRRIKEGWALLVLMWS